MFCEWAREAGTGLPGGRTPGERGGGTQRTATDWGELRYARPRREASAVDAVGVRLRSRSWGRRCSSASAWSLPTAHRCPVSGAPPLVSGGYFPGGLWAPSPCSPRASTACLKGSQAWWGSRPRSLRCFHRGHEFPRQTTTARIPIAGSGKRDPRHRGDWPATFLLQTPGLLGAVPWASDVLLRIS